MITQVKYVIVNENGLFLMQIGVKEYAFTVNINNAMKFIDEGNAQLQIRKLPLYKGLHIWGTMITPVMMDSKYASVTQLIELAKAGRHEDMRYLLQNCEYSRYAISLNRKQIVKNDTPQDIAVIVMDYHESALATL